MAENGLSDPVIGVSLDGTGYGTDGNIWGSEFMLAEPAHFERVKHFEYIPVQGGDLATKQPWRSALSYLHTYFGRGLMDLNLDFCKTLESNRVASVMNALERNINCPLSCSAGRLFDAVAVLLHLCLETSFHAEAPMRLEDCLARDEDGLYNVDIGNVISFRHTFRQLIDDKIKTVPVQRIAAKFHNTVAFAIAESTASIAKQYNISNVALSGGTFQNRYLVEKLLPLLEKKNLNVFMHRKVPCNDGGIALGQAIIAASKQ
jgi:hydrogenase maturation protein HypF